ncbi:MAG: hypothetical protein VYE08_07155, partial [Candidatus Thermoplasmatota archaeon]|nr:hypothetical protein [Candidatus Thermoplasmatota archaeon]
TQGSRGDPWHHVKSKLKGSLRIVPFKLKQVGQTERNEGRGKDLEQEDETEPEPWQQRSPPRLHPTALTLDRL